MPKNVIEQVVADELCTGCGLCSGHFGPAKAVMAINTSGYLRPFPKLDLNKQEQTEFKSFCPGIMIELKSQTKQIHQIWGPLVSCSVGWATDSETRHQGSSGGGISALLISMIESGAADFVAHNGADPVHPFRNVLKISRSRAEVLSAAGSRYSPSGPLAGLAEILAQPGRFVFVGKPCDAAALRSYLKGRPHIAERVAAIVAFMCAGIPSEKGTEEVVKKLGAKPADVARFSYRGNGWPGNAIATLHDGRQLEMDYASSWGNILNRHLQFRCKICPDGTGEFADLVCADAWYGKDGYPDFAEQAGRSLILARTDQGQTLLEAAVATSHLKREDCPVEDISLMQPYQESRKRLLVSRLAALFLRRGRIPKFKGMRLIRSAIGIGPSVHWRNFIGTIRRIPSQGKS